MSQWQNNSCACLCLCPNNSSVQRRDSQVNNCSMCAPWTWTTAFNRRRHWSTIRIRQQVRTAHSCVWRHEAALQICLSDSLHRTAGYSCKLFNIYRTFAGPRVVFLTAYWFSYMLDILFHSDSPRPSTTSLRRDQVRCVNHTQKISNRTDCSLLVRKFFTNKFCTPSLFLIKEFNWQFIFICERRVYQQIVA